MSSQQIINRKASHEYHLLERYEAGIELKGAEVKSIRAGEANLKESFIRIDNGQAYVYGMHISPYNKSSVFTPDPVRTRRLLLHKSQISKLESSVQQKGFTLVPTKLYFKGGRVKIEIAVAKGKKMFDKRQSIKKRQLDREIDRSVKNR